MPRSGRGGTRTGTPGKSYSNRTDLNGPAQLPVQAAPGQAYGAAAEQKSAQRSVPMAPTQAPTPQPTSPPSGQTTGPPPLSGLVAPGSLTPLDAPTQRPNEPLTSGMSTGPGPGPEALTGGGDPLIRAAAVLNLLGSNADPQTAALRAQISATLANRNAP